MSHSTLQHISRLQNKYKTLANQLGACHRILKRKQPSCTTTKEVAEKNHHENKLV